MKLYKFLLYSLPIIGAVSCTKVEKIEVEHIGGYNTMENAESEAYYASLREFKNGMWNYQRPVSFGWFSEWAPEGPARKGYLSSVPDSMDIISMWCGAPAKKDLTEAQLKDKEFVQKKKGIKLLEVSLLSHLGKGRTPAEVYDPVYKKAEAEKWSDEKLSTALKAARWKYWGFNGNLNDTPNLKEALSKYAKSLCDALYENEWDGFDIDWEPGMGFSDADGTLANNRYESDLIVHLVKEMGKYIGPMSDPENKGHKLLCVDGLISVFEDNCPEYIDYFIKQDYNGYITIPDKNSWKYISTENFESTASISGGSIMNFANYCPKDAPKGGVGAYRFTKDYDNAPTYKWMRKAIQANLESFYKWKETHPEWNGAPKEEDNKEEEGNKEEVK